MIIHVITLSSFLKQILMSAQVIPARTTGPAETERTDSTAVVHRAFKEHSVKQVTPGHNLNKFNFYYFCRAIGNRFKIVVQQQMSMLICIAS